MGKALEELQFKTEEKMPEWGHSAEWLFKNKNGERWIGKLEKDAVVVAGSDIGWSEIILNKKHARQVLEVVLKGKKPTSDFEHNPLSKWILLEDELFWIISIIKASKEKLVF